MAVRIGQKNPCTRPRMAFSRNKEWRLASAQESYPEWCLQINTTFDYHIHLIELISGVLFAIISSEFIFHVFVQSN